MRCEDCLPLIEEYFDGEVTGQTSEAVGAHLSACADCAAALDALSFEQEVYARYDRGGLEVTPDLWARVSAEIARTPPPSESPAAGRNFLSRARDHFAAALGTLAARPALASSLALLLVSAAVGTLWLSRRQQPNAPARDAARQTTDPAAGVIPTAPGTDVADRNTTVTSPPTVDFENEGAPAGYEPRESPREPETAQNAPRRAPAGGAGISLEELLAEPSAAQDDPNLVKLRPDNHARADETAALLLNASAPGREVAGADARPLDPEEKDMARHVERAQMLLRSIKNVRASEMADADITYEKDLSRKLLAENATLQLEAEVNGDKETKQVLDQLEPFLLEIANMGEKPSREEVRSIRERVKKDEIVAALQVY
jgi:hypothetical protein